MNKQVQVLVLMCLVILFVGLSLPFLNRPLDTWEWLNHAAAGQVAARGIPSLTSSNRPESLLLIHPPSGAYLSAAGICFWGDGNWQRRLPGVGVTLLTAVCLFFVSKKFFQEKPADPRTLGTWGTSGADPADQRALETTALYLINPAVLQGSLYLSFSEGTFLPLVFTLFGGAGLWWAKADRSALGTWGTGGADQSGPVFQIFVYGFLFFLALWAKVTTSLVLPLVLALLALPLMLSGQKFWKSLAVSVGAGVVGGGLFLFSWGMYVFWLHEATQAPLGFLFFMPFQYVASQGAPGHPAFHITQNLVALWRVILYLGPWLCVLAAVSFFLRLKDFWRTRQTQPEDLIQILTWTVFCGYLISLGGSGAFPKYQFAVVPFLCLLTVRSLDRFFPPSRLFSQGFFLALMGVGFLYYAGVVGDLVFLFNHEWRKCLVWGLGQKEVGLQMAIKFFLYMAFPLVLWAAVVRFKPQGARDVLMASLLSAPLALIYHQAVGGYFVMHSYGTRYADFTKAIDILKEETPPGSALLALPEFCYLSGRTMAPGLTRSDWDNPQRLTELIEKTKPSSVVYGLPTHTVEQMKRVFKDPSFLAFLQDQYRFQEVGEYVLWVSSKKQDL